MIRKIREDSFAVFNGEQLLIGNLDLTERDQSKLNLMEKKYSFTVQKIEYIQAEDLLCLCCFESNDNFEEA